MHLYETHLPVISTEASSRFYIDVVGLEFGYRDPNRDIVFLFIGSGRQSMLGLWGPSTTLGRHLHPHHFAISVPCEELVQIATRLNSLGIATHDFQGASTREPSVIGWMPSAQIYFSDADGHSVEFISLLDAKPRPEFIGSLSEWYSIP